MEQPEGVAIEEHREGYSRHTLMNKLSPFLGKTETSQYLIKEAPIHLIIGLSKINFHRHKSTSTLFPFEGMHNFIHQNGILLDTTIWNKSVLKTGNKPRDNRLQTGRQNFRDDLI